MKNKAEMPAGKLRPNKVPEKPWQHISVDFITKLLVSKGYNLILVVCDRFSKMSHFVVMIEKIIAERLTKELNKMLGIETKLFTTYHPQTDGQMRRIN